MNCPVAVFYPCINKREAGPEPEPPLASPTWLLYRLNQPITSLALPVNVYGGVAEVFIFSPALSLVGEYRFHSSCIWSTN